MTARSHALPLAQLMFFRVLGVSWGRGSPARLVAPGALWQMWWNHHQGEKNVGKSPAHRGQCQSASVGGEGIAK